MRQNVQQKPRYQRIQKGNRRIGQQRARKSDRGGHLIGDIVEHDKRQIAGGIEQHEAGADRRLVQCQLKHQRHQPQGRNRINDRPQITTGRAAMRRGHFAQNQRHYGARGTKSARPHRIWRQQTRAGGWHLRLHPRLLKQ